MPRHKLTLEYEGTNYHGWQKQPGLATVQGSLEEALQKLCQQPIESFAAGRTDTGVHALGQVVHIDMPEQFSSQTILRGTNFYLRHAQVVIREVLPAAENFHARFAAIRRHYLYRILNRDMPSAIERNRTWHVRRPLNVEAMQAAAQLLIGKHDFSSFRHPGCYAASPVKTMERIDISAHGEEIHLRFSAPSFLYHMVRNLVGTLVYVGNGKFSVQHINTILAARDRSIAGPTAPASGLYFHAVDYPSSI